MANRNFNRVQALEKESKHLYAEVNIGASGAPTIVKALGISSISRSAAGTYSVTLEDKYMRLLHVDVMQLASAAEDLTFQVKSNNVSTTKVIEIFSKAAAVATDPSNGSKLFIKIEVKNSSI